MNELTFTGFVEHVGQPTLTAVLPVKVRSHKNAGTALLSGTLPPQTVNLTVVIHLVVLEHGQLHLAVLVLDLLGCGVVLLLALLATTPQPENQVERGLLLDIVVGQGAPVLKLFAGKDQSLLVRGNSLLVLKQGQTINAEFVTIIIETQVGFTQQAPDYATVLRNFVTIIIKAHVRIQGHQALGRGQHLTMQPYLNFGLHILDGVAGLHLQGDGLPRQRFDEDLHGDALLCTTVCRKLRE